jgi:hypothetical protein
MSKPLPTVPRPTAGTPRLLTVMSAVAGSKKRITVTLAAVVLLAAGIWAYAVHTAPPAYAATVVTGGLDISVNPGSVTVGIGTVSATVTYTCTDTSGEVGVTCGIGRAHLPRRRAQPA